MIFLDCETRPIAKCYQAPRIVVVGFCGDLGPVRLVTDRAEVRALFVDALSHGICGHNVSFDIGCACAEWPELLPLAFEAFEAGRVRDTMVREWLYVNARVRLPKSGFGLASSYARHAGTSPRDKADTWRLRYQELEGVPLDRWPPEAVRYVVDDVTETRELYQRQGDVGPDEVRQTRAAWALHLCATWGIMTDLDAVNRLEAALRGEKAEIDALMLAEGLVWGEKPDREARKAHKLATGQALKHGKVGSRNIAAVRARVTAAYGGTPPTTDKAGIKTDGLTCSESGDPVLKAYGRLGVVSSSLATSLPLLREGVIHTRFKFAASGRSTSGEDEDGEGDGNVQNINTAGGIRSCFIPRPGLKMIAADYGSLELCTLAQVCLDLFRQSVLAGELNSGRSPLLAFGAAMGRISYEEAEARHKQKDPAVKALRQSAKVALYGFPGGLSKNSLPPFALRKYDVRITSEESAALKKHYLEHYTEMRYYFDYVGKVSAGGFIRQLRSNRIRAGVGYTDACNGFFQALGADVAKSAVFEVQRRCYADRSSALYGWRTINFVHDEIRCEGPPDRAEEAAAELSHVMVACAKPWLPDVTILAPAKISDRWLEDS